MPHTHIVCIVHALHHRSCLFAPLLTHLLTHFCILHILDLFNTYLLACLITHLLACLLNVPYIFACLFAYPPHSPYLLVSLLRHHHHHHHHHHQHQHKDYRCICRHGMHTMGCILSTKLTSTKLTSTKLMYCCNGVNGVFVPGHVHIHIMHVCMCCCVVVLVHVACASVYPSHLLHLHTCVITHMKRA